MFIPIKPLIMIQRQQWFSFQALYGTISESNKNMIQRQQWWMHCPLALHYSHHNIMNSYNIGYHKSLFTPAWKLQYDIVVSCYGLSQKLWLREVNSSSEEGFVKTMSVVRMFLTTPDKPWMVKSYPTGDSITKV